ncbi:MAG: hypothetical protein ACR2PL_12025 [Dehalococcoidia bacterium]
MADSSTAHVLKLGTYVTALAGVFKRASSKHEAHYRSRAILADMSADPSVLTAALAKHLASSGALNTKHYPVIGLDIELNPNFGLVANCWIPLPDGATNISTKAIHHHGDMLLTTVTAFGPGYEHWTFTRPAEIDSRAELYSMEVIERAPHPLHHVAFVDSYIAHLPLYPPSLTITLALWSSQHATTWKDRLKRAAIVRGHREALRGLAARAGLRKALDLKIVEYFDFCPTPDGFRGLKERTEFERGPNDDYLFSLFHILQQTGNESLTALIEQQLASTAPVEHPELIRHLTRDLRMGHAIAGRLSPGHFGVPHANFTRQDIERALAIQHIRRAPAAAA